ncbi:MAG: hypothetical protein GPJ51_07160 [Candidatus Heimdallarchaeota archaeon]|nr:hypothetical protein [Candidatus Heimdallarchaeota archaeon]
MIAIDKKGRNNFVFGDSTLDQLMRVKKKDRKKAANTLALAFMEDPLSCWFFKDEDTRFCYLLNYLISE